MEKKAGREHVIGIPVNNRAFGIEEPDFSSKGAARNAAAAGRAAKSGWTTGDRVAQGLKEHVALGPNLYETVRGKLSLGARILRAGGVEKAFRRWFSVVGKGERLLRASQCYLSTTAGPIAGTLFVSTERIAFRSDRSLALTSPKRGTVVLVRVPYKVSIPLGRVKTATPGGNKDRPEQKYVQVVTDDGFVFWFMGFVRYQVSLHELEKAIKQAQAQ
ncbi:FIP1 [Zea mays]|uniref:FIP1 n=1 Tax=Zea mays TaxID=4577 RepID=B6SU92_MAIZE|nr:FIP1 [Zea mays]ACG28425.1 FIP1 [Zea mays]ONM15795.1 FIP1 [Zea mays]|eukprot:NP_001147706.1 FIP1 [Zea mays]